MKPFAAIVAYSNNRVDKFQDFDTLEDAQDHVATHGGFAASSLSAPVQDWFVSGDPPGLSMVDAEPLVAAKERRVIEAWVYCQSLTEAGTVTIQSDTATTPVDHVFGTDSITTQLVWQSKMIAINDGHITTTLDLTPSGELDPVTFTVEEFRTAARAAHNYVDDRVKHYKTIKKAIMEAVDHAAVSAIDIEAGYPA